MSDCGFFVLVPKAIDTAALVSTTVAMPDPALEMPDGSVGEVAWVSGTSYAEGVRVIRTSTRRRYRRTAATGSATALPEKSPLLWIDEGSINRWAWADSKASTSTVAASAYSMTVRPGACTAIELLGLRNVALIEVNMLDEPGGSVVFSLTASTDEFSGADPHWSFYFEGPLQGTTYSVSGMPVYPGCEITITLSSYDGQSMGIGLIAFGNYEFIGLPQFGFEVTRTDYSYSVKDRWGEEIRRPGLKAKNLRGTALLEPWQANAVDEALARLLDEGAVFVPSLRPEHRYLKTWGRIQPARISAAGHTHVILDLDVKGLV